MRMELLCNATVVDRAVRFVDNQRFNPSKEVTLGDTSMPH
jgi:hypothetical protein